MLGIAVLAAAGFAYMKMGPGAARSGGYGDMSESIQRFVPSFGGDEGHRGRRDSGRSSGSDDRNYEHLNSAYQDRIGNPWKNDR